MCGFILEINKETFNGGFRVEDDLFHLEKSMHQDAQDELDQERIELEYILGKLKNGEILTITAAKIEISQVTNKVEYVPLDKQGESIKIDDLKNQGPSELKAMIKKVVGIQKVQ